MGNGHPQHLGSLFPFLLLYQQVSLGGVIQPFQLPISEVCLRFDATQDGLGLEEPIHRQV